MNCSAAGLLHPDPTGVDRVGADRRTANTQPKSRQNKPSDTSRLCWTVRGRAQRHSSVSWPDVSSADDSLSILLDSNFFFLWEGNMSPSFGHVRELHYHLNHQRFTKTGVYIFFLHTIVQLVSVHTTWIQWKQVIYWLRIWSKMSYHSERTVGRIRM